MADGSYTGLVLAASRGNLDPLAQAGGVSHVRNAAGRRQLDERHTAARLVIDDLDGKGLRCSISGEK